MRRALGVAVVLLLTACGQSASPPPFKSGPPTPSPAATAAGGLAAWQQRGATEVPPASIAGVTLDGIQVVDQTNGAVSEADAQRWALAYVRANAYEFWAWNHLQDQFLQNGQLSPVALRVFAYDLSTIRDARSAGVQLTVTRLVLRRLVLRPVAAALRTAVQAQVFVYAPYAFYLDQVGPSELDWVDAHGTKTAKARRDTGVAAPELVGGQLTSDPLLGDIWSVDSDFDCTAPNVRQEFGALCNQ